MTNIKESRSLFISNKIFTSDDIRSLSLLFKKQLNEILDKCKETKREEMKSKNFDDNFIEEMIKNVGKIDVELTSSDGSQYAGKIEDIMEAEDFLNSNKLIKIKFYFGEYSTDSMIYITIEHSFSRACQLKIEGFDRTWVNGSIKKFDDFFKNCKDQASFIRKYKWAIISTIVVLLSVVLLNLGNFIIYKIISQNNTQAEFFSLYKGENLILSSWAVLSITIFPAISIYERIRRLWPTIELQTGKDFHQIEKIKRDKLKLFIIVILIPSLLSFIPLLFKNAK